MDNYLRWNAVNWFTVVLMVTVAYIAFGFIANLIKQAAGNMPGTIGMGGGS